MTDKFRFEHWKAANNSRDSFSWFDYAHCVLRDQRIAGDMAVAIARLVWPDFIEVEGLVFLADQYSEEKAATLRNQGVDGHWLEYWINLFSVDGFFDGISASSEDHDALSCRLATAWRKKVETEFLGRNFVVEIVNENDSEDICVALYQGPNLSTLSR